MSHTSKEEYLESCRQRYPGRNRAGKSAMIDEVCDTIRHSAVAPRRRE